MTNTPTFGVATYNIGNGPDARKVDDLVTVATHPRGHCAIIGMQEGGDRRAMLTRYKRTNPGWRVHQPRRPGASSVPIAWHGPTFKLLRTRSALAVARSWVGRRGAGPTFAKPKRVNVVVLRHRETGLRVRVLNTHAIPSTTRHNLPGRELAARTAHLAQHVAKVVDMVERSKDPVVVTADWNATPEWPALRPLRRAGLRGWTRNATHGRRRAIDHVLHVGLQNVRGYRAPTSSDHHAVARVYRAG